MRCVLRFSLVSVVQCILRNKADVSLNILLTNYLPGDTGSLKAFGCKIMPANLINKIIRNTAITTGGIAIKNERLLIVLSFYITFYIRNCVINLDKS